MLVRSCGRALERAVQRRGHRLTGRAPLTPACITTMGGLLASMSVDALCQTAGEGETVQRPARHRQIGALNGERCVKRALAARARRARNVLENALARCKNDKTGDSSLVKGGGNYSSGYMALPRCPARSCAHNVFCSRFDIVVSILFCRDTSRLFRR